MSNLAKLEFMALDISGKNYLSWILDAEIHLDAMGLGDAIKEGNETSNQEKARAMIFLRHHLHEELKSEYLTVKNPLVLWTNLKERFDHQKTKILPNARNKWMELRFQDFKSVAEYNSALFKITSQLRLCGEKIDDSDLLEKTFSTFHATNVLLQQQYRAKGFTKYSDLLSCLLVAEQNNELLMKNHEARPTGSAPFPEANASQVNRNRGHARSRGSNKGRGQYHSVNHSGRSKNPTRHQKWQSNNKGKSGNNNKNVDNLCHRCGMNGHWSRTCRTPKHLADLYQASLKNKGKSAETNFVQEDVDFNQGYDDITHLDVADFFSDPDGRIDHLTGDGTVQK